MKIWKYSRLDSILFALSIMQFLLTFYFSENWLSFSISEKLSTCLCLVFMMGYNIIVISHLFTHTPWFKSAQLNCLVSMLNSFNINQSVQAYHLTHVRNHHRYNNDQKGSSGKPKDSSSTFKDGTNQNHTNVFRYAFIGAISSLHHTLLNLASVIKLFSIGKRDYELLSLMSKFENKRSIATRQLRLDRMAHFLGVCSLTVISWEFTLVAYLPSFYLALAFVNIQNYYEHFGSKPGNRFANSVSFYGRVWNTFSFNDGYHQEHHLRPGAHWKTMEQVRQKYRSNFNRTERIVSPVPAIIGFMDRQRAMLHLSKDNLPEGIGNDENIVGEEAFL